MGAETVALPKTKPPIWLCFGGRFVCFQWFGLWIDGFDFFCLSVDFGSGVWREECGRAGAVRFGLRGLETSTSFSRFDCARGIGGFWGALRGVEADFGGFIGVLGCDIFWRLL